MTIILLPNLLIGLEKQREAKGTHVKINICPAHGNPWSAQPSPGQVPLRRTDRKCGRSKKLGPLCLPRNARNDSTVFRNSPPRFFDSNYALGLIFKWFMISYHSNEHDPNIAIQTKESKYKSSNSSRFKNAKVAPFIQFPFLLDFCESFPFHSNGTAHNFEGSLKPTIRVIF